MGMLDTSYRMPLIGDNAPSFSAQTTKGKLDFPNDYKGKWVVLFSHPADFTPVCTTEFMAFQAMQKSFQDIDTELLGLSVDSIYSHIAWLRTIRDRIVYNGMKNVEINFPVIEDVGGNIAKLYGMLQPGASGTNAVRAVLIIDPNAIVRAVLYYPISTGRNMREISRMVVAIQKADREGIATPADWQPGDDVILFPPSSTKAASRRLKQADIDDKKYCMDWFMCFRKDTTKRL